MDGYGDYTLTGNGGANSLRGPAGNDVFVFSTRLGIDKVDGIAELWPAVAGNDDTI